MISFTPTDGIEINLFPVQSINYPIKSNIQFAGKIAGVSVHYILQKQDVIKMSATWLNKTIDSTPIYEYIRSHSKYGTLKIGDYTYNVALDFSATVSPVVEGDLIKASLEFTLL